MRVLIIATSAKPQNAEEEILHGKRPRLEYVELGKQLKSPYLDYDSSACSYSPYLRQMEERLKLDLFWARQLAKKIHREGFDVALSMSERIGIPLAHFLDRRVRHYVILHHPMSANKLRIVKALNTFRRWDKLLPLSEAETAALQKEFKLNGERIETVHYAVDTDFYRPMEGDPAGQPGDGEKFILSLGLSNRDYPTLIRALRMLPEIECEISGTSAWVDHGAGLGREDLPANVRMVNYNHPQVIRAAYARSRFVVIPLDPQTSQWSAGSASVLQPQAMGRPVIATAIPGMYDYIQDGKTGLLVKGGDPEALAEAIDYLWNNPAVVEQMGVRARDWVQANYSYERWMQDVRRIIRA